MNSKLLEVENYELFELNQNEDCNLVIHMLYDVFYMIIKFYGLLVPFWIQGCQSESWYA